MTLGQFADKIATTVHPSLLELGPRADGLVNRKGVLEWHPDKLTRLEIPASASGFGIRWIDYATATEATEARDRARAIVSQAASIDAALAAMDEFYRAE